jgi:hypothetical protein
MPADGTHSGISLGPGPERHTYSSALSQILAQDMFWRTHSSSDALVPNYLTNVGAMSRARQWKTFGAFFAVLLLHDALSPPRLSKWVMFALLDPSFAPPFSLIRKFEPDMANRLAVWFERPEGPIVSLHLGTSPNGQPTPIDWLICEVFGNQTVCSSSFYLRATPAS